MRRQFEKNGHWGTDAFASRQAGRRASDLLSPQSRILLPARMDTSFSRIGDEVTMKCTHGLDRLRTYSLTRRDHGT